ncbi:MAG: (2Fe-2S) ferredoxin domain-containing protein [Bacillota bacterium]
MNFQELQQWKQEAQAKSQLRGKRARARVTVGMGTCGIKAGAGAVLAAIKEELHRLGMAEVVVAHVGCKGLCTKEPLVEVSLPDHPAVIYGDVTPATGREIVRRHLQGGQALEIK